MAEPSLLEILHRVEQHQTPDPNAPFEDPSKRNMSLIRPVPQTDGAGVTFTSPNDGRSATGAETMTLAPAVAQPSAPAGTAAVHPNAPAVASGTPPTAEVAPPEQDTGAEDAARDGARNVAAATAQRGAHTLQLYPSSYSDPVVTGTAANRKLINVYELSLYDDWATAKPNKPSSVTLPDVQRITMQAPNALTRTRNLAGQVYAEHGGFIQRTFVIEGRSGPVWNLPTEDGAGQLAISRFTKLRNLIERYGRDSVANKNALVRNKDTRLTFQASFESEAHFCDIVNFTYRRSSATSTYSFEYSITLVTNGVAEKKYNGGFALTVGKAVPVWESQKLRTFAALTAAELAALPADSEAAANVFRPANAFKGLSCSDIHEWRQAASALNITLDTAIFTRTIAPEVVAGLKTGLAYNSYLTDITHSLKGARGLSCPVPPWSDLYYNWLPAGTGVTTLAALLANTPSFSGFNNQYRTADVLFPVRRAFITETDTQPPPPFTAVNYFLPDSGADAHSVAAAVLGDRNQWWRIVALNRLRDAYTRSDGTPLAPGSSLLIPDPTVPNVKDNDVLGTDLLIVNGDLELAGSNDIMRVKGYANYTQNLLHRMHTPRGSNKVFTEFGLSPTIHTDSSSTVLATIRNDIRDQVNQDHRTDSVTDIQITELGDKVQVSMVVKAIASDQRSFSFNYNLSSEVTQ